tara:strand:+ start:4920 stop:5315 length:396 start_codon:yes stop_codon:yes gene_type:complete
MSATNFLEDEILDHILGEGVRNFTPSTTLYIGLFTAVADGEAGSVTEVSGNGYARTAVTFNAASSSACTNSGDVTFPAASGGAWGTITHIGVYSALTVGDLYFVGSLSASKTVDDGDIFQISDTNLSISMN